MVIWLNVKSAAKTLEARRRGTKRSMEKILFIARFDINIFLFINNFLISS